ncbi:MAG: tRNA pseudouridine(55) synthase TruB [Chloroflexota bacterium]
MLGVVNLDKPVGVTSHDMVGLLRRLSGMRRIGHAGTLDPLASGVLPILVGAATRFSEELTGGRKRYTATVRFGIRSATDDAEGPLEASGAPLPDRAAIEAALAGQRGTFDQRPPAFSARKQGGLVAHRAARAGAPLDLPPRTVTVMQLDLLRTEGGDGRVDAWLDIVCGAGTYIRSIARDLGETLGCGAHLHALRRLEAAGLHAETAVTPEELERLAADGALEDAVLPITDLLPFAQLTVDAPAFVHGSPTRMEDGEPDGRRVVLDRTGRLLGIGVVSGGLLQPEKVVAAGVDA